MKALAAALALVAVLAVAAPARAQPATVNAQPVVEQESYTQHYGLKILAADVASLATVFAGFMFWLDDDLAADPGAPSQSYVRGPALMVVGGLGFVFAGPVIHSLHRNQRGAAKSFLVKAGLPLAGLVGGMTLDDGNDTPAPALMALGVLAAVMVDDALFAQRTVTRNATVSAYAAPSPTGGMTVGLAGAF